MEKRRWWEGRDRKSDRTADGIAGSKIRGQEGRREQVCGSEKGEKRRERTDLDQFLTGVLLEQRYRDGPVTGRTERERKW